MTRSHQRCHILVGTALQACRAEQKVGWLTVYNRKVYRGLICNSMRSFVVREWALCCILTYSRWSKGCPVPSSPGWRRWSCLVARGYGSWSCSRKQTCHVNEDVQRDHQTQYQDRTVRAYKQMVRHNTLSEWRTECTHKHKVACMDMHYWQCCFNNQCNQL